LDLKIKDVAELLNVSETTIRRWLAEGKIPAYRLNHHYRFSLIEIENWMMSCRLKQRKESLLREVGGKVDLDLQIDGEKPSLDGVQKRGNQQFGLYRAIYRGDVLDDSSQTKEELIKKTMERVADTLSLDPTVISELLLDREKLMPTALSNGIAVPHTRDFLLKGPRDVVAVVFPKRPIDWGALDAYPVHTLFFLFACDNKRHLSLLAKLAHLSNNDTALRFLRSQPNKRELLNYIKVWEAKISN